MKIQLLSFAFGLLLFASCKKDNNQSPEKTSNELVSQALNDFGPKIAVPTYANLHSKAQMLENSIKELRTNATQGNLIIAQNQWFATRTAWEQSECMLFGPVATEALDPAIDTWPVNQNEVDSLLASSNVLGSAQIEELGKGLKGFHPMEYLLFGNGRTRKITELSQRQLDYLVALAENLVEKTEAMHSGWVATGGNYTAELANAGKGSTIFPSRQDAFLEIANAIVDIVGEVGEAKIQEPFAARDSLLEESPFAMNSWNDFKDNIIGAKNTYMGTVLDQNSTSIHHFVAKNNSALDVQIQQAFDRSIANLSAFSTPFGRAIFSQPAQVQTAQTNLASLKTLFDEKLIPLIQLQVKN